MPCTYSASGSAKRAVSMFLSVTGRAVLNPVKMRADATKIVERRISSKVEMNKMIWELKATG